MNDDDIINKGGTQDDINSYAERNGASYDQELKEAVLGRLKHAYYNSVTDDIALKNGVIPNKNHALRILGFKADEIMELIKQDREVYGIECEIKELERLRIDRNKLDLYEYHDIDSDRLNSQENGEQIKADQVLEYIDNRIAELQTKKDNLIKGVK